MMMSVNRRRVMTMAAASLLARPAMASTVQPVVIELFTSQGCSSCPAADAYLRELKTKPGHVVLSYHVDYWDYLGWRDTLGSADFSKRQYDYARARGDMEVYTPQAIVNGDKHFIGGQKSVLADAIAIAQTAKRDAWVEMAMSDNATDVVIEIGKAETRNSATLWFVTIAPRLEVKIEKGENAGQVIEYHNVVTKVMPAGMWRGDATRIVLPKKSLMQDPSKGWVALLQRDSLGPIIGVATGGIVS
jgi:hypothetical protein